MSDTTAAEGMEPEPVEARVYVVTGTNNLRLPESFCEECNLFVNAVQEASEEAGVPVDVSVRSWWTHLPFALRRRGYHPPVLVVGGRRVAQGHDVPSKERIIEVVREAARNRRD